MTKTLWPSELEDLLTRNPPYATPAEWASLVASIEDLRHTVRQRGEQINALANERCPRTPKTGDQYRTVECRDYMFDEVTGWNVREGLPIPEPVPDETT